MLFYVPFLVVTGAVIYLLFLLRYEALTKRQLQILPFSAILIRVQKQVVK